MNRLSNTELADVIRGLGIDNDKKAQLLELLNEKKTFGLIWEKQQEDDKSVLSRSIPILSEDRSKAIESTPESINHILIEGDNLLALTDLCYTHEGEVDVIYIDPPYNTGNDDFIYNDSFIGENDSLSLE